MHVTITINGTPVTREIEPRELLVHFIRETPGLTGTHWGCDTSNCGACVVLMDGKPIKSCTTLAAMCEGHEIRTVEWLEVDGAARSRPAGLPRDARPALRVLHAGHDDDDPGPARREPEPDRPRDPRPRSPAAICRCTGYKNIVAAVRWAAEHEATHPTGGLTAMAIAENLPSADPGAADRLRPPEAQGGRALHPRQGHLPGRHPPARDAPRRDPAQPVRAREDHLDRHLGGAGTARRRRGRHRQGPGDARARVDADDLLRHPGRAGRRQGPLPGPGGGVRDRDRRVHRPRRAAADRGRVRAAAAGRQRPQGARPRCAADPRRQARPGRQPRQPDLGGRRRGGDRARVRRGRRRSSRATSSTRAVTRRRSRRAG